VSIIGWLADEADKVPKLKPVIEAAQEKSGSIRIVVSALALAEVLWLKNAPRLGKEKERKIKNFFKHEYIVVVDVDTRTAELARELVWDHNVRPKDAIHVATAILRKAEQLDTFDDELLIPAYHSDR
jgi:predicted nucleic acid-binding protein